MTRTNLGQASEGSARSSEPPSAESRRPAVGSPADDLHDVELIRWSLSLTPEDRLEVLQDFVDAFWAPIHG